MSRIQIRDAGLETVLDWRMRLSDPPRSRAEALSPGDLAPDASHFGAWLDDKLVGVGSIGPEPLPLLDNPPAWRLRGLVVLPDYRNRAVGPALIRHQLQSVAEKPNPLAWSYVKRKHVEFFGHFGYHPTGHIHIHPVSGETLLCGNIHTLALINGAAHEERHT